MADKATSNSSASIFLDEIKSSMGGALNYQPAAAIAASSGEGWVYGEYLVAYNGNTTFFTAASDFMGNQGVVATGDLVMWVAIKNTSTTVTDGICISLDNGVTPAYTLVTGIFIGAGEMVILKLGKTTTAHLIARSVTMDGTYGYASDAHAGTVPCIAAAIIKNIG